MWLSPLCQLGRPFFVLLLAENIFVAGGSIAVFAIGAWVYQQSNSLFDFSLVATAGALSTLAVLPFAGALADRFDRRKAILWSDAGVLCLMGVLLWVMAKNGVALWLLYVFSVIVALAHALRTPAYRTTMSALLQREQMPLACGLMGIVNGLVGIGVPIIAGMLMYRYGLDGIFIFNLVAIACSLLLAAAALYRVPSSLLNSSDTAGTGANVGGLRRDFSRAIAYFCEHRLMAFLLLYVLVQECLEALVSTLITPLILTVHSVRELGGILSWGGLGCARMGGHLELGGAWGCIGRGAAAGFAVSVTPGAAAVAVQHAALPVCGDSQPGRHHGVLLRQCIRRTVCRQPSHRLCHGAVDAQGSARSAGQRICTYGFACRDCDAGHGAVGRQRRRPLVASGVCHGGELDPDCQPLAGEW
ncbi:MFS transporter [Pseudomonas rhodesiae]|uniref:MFS transporter n=1 Tax=Pseudomonas rhodesiae TaxID=76760 RepID=UPI00058F83CF|nr:MFS transporter [Pseudomonas rhodesiae]